MSDPSSPPSVSVIVPNYNHARFLPRRIDSILAQSFQDFELVILDDASTDDSTKVIERYLDDPRVQFLPNTVNSGSPFIQWNRGVALARGEFVWIAESDDYADPKLLETLTALLRANPRAGLAYCQSRRVDETGRVLGSMSSDVLDLDPHRWHEPFVGEGREECRRFLLWKNTIPNASAVVFRRDVFLRAGGAVTTMRLAGDWLTWVHMLLVSNVVFTPEHLNYFREHRVSVRAKIAYRTFLAERCTIQLELLRKNVATVEDRRMIAARSVNEHLSAIRLGAHGFDLRELVRGLRIFWPIYVREPLGTLNAASARVRRN